MSYVICHMSYVLCLLSYVLCLMSFLLCLMSYVLSLMSYVLCLLSFVFCLMSYVLCLMSYVLWVWIDDISKNIMRRETCLNERLTLLTLPPCNSGHLSRGWHTELSHHIETGNVLIWWLWLEQLLMYRMVSKSVFVSPISWRGNNAKGWSSWDWRPEITNVFPLPRTSLLCWQPKYLYKYSSDALQSPAF